MQVGSSERERLAHLFLRIPSESRVGGKSEQVIYEHNTVFLAMNKVFFCKFGARPNEKMIERLRDQIASKMTTFVYFSVRVKKDFVGYRAEMGSIEPRAWDPNMRRFAPPYYDAINQEIYNGCLWLEIRSEISRCDLMNLRLFSNKRPLLEVLHETRTASMMVEQVHS